MLIVKSTLNFFIIFNVKGNYNERTELHSTINIKNFLLRKRTCGQLSKISACGLHFHDYNNTYYRQVRFTVMEFFWIVSCLIISILQLEISNTNNSICCKSQHPQRWMTCNHHATNYCSMNVRHVSLEIKLIYNKNKSESLYLPKQLGKTNNTGRKIRRESKKKSK